MTIQNLGTGAALSASTTPAQVAARSTNSIGLWFHNPAASAVTLVIAKITGTSVADRLAEIDPGDSFFLAAGPQIRPFYYTLSSTLTASVHEVF